MPRLPGRTRRLRSVARGGFFASPSFFAIRTIPVESGNRTGVVFLARSSGLTAAPVGLRKPVGGRRLCLARCPFFQPKKNDPMMTLITAAVLSLSGITLSSQADVLSRDCGCAKCSCEVCFDCPNCCEGCECK